MVNRINFLLKKRFDKRYYDRLGIDLLREAGFEVRVYDLMPVLDPDHFEEYNFSEVPGFRGLNIIYDKETMYKTLRSMTEQDFAVNLINYFHYWSYDVLKALSASGAQYAVFCSNAVPLPETKRDRFHLLSERLKKIPSLGITGLYRRSIMSLPFKLMGIKPARLVLSGGDCLISNFRKSYTFDDTSEILDVHTLDYDIFLKEKNNTAEDRRIAVFLDENYIYHREWSMANTTVPISKERYWKLLNDFFSFVEKTTGLKVVIAEHPSSDYSSSDVFMGRECIKNRTSDLIKESRLVLCHSCTAVNFAVLYEKPVRFITSRELNESEQGPYIRTMSKLLGEDLIFLDSEGYGNPNLSRVFNNKKYSEYRNKYIKKDGTEDTPVWQILADRLKKGL